MKENFYQKDFFSPPWWLRNCHLQSCLGVLFAGKKPNQHIYWEQLELPDGDFIDLCWIGSNLAPKLILMPGLEGSFESHYIRMLINPLCQAGYQAVVMHYRSCSGRLNRLSRSYHGGDTSDFEYLVSVIRMRWPNIPIGAIGFSLGGHLLLRSLGSQLTSPLKVAIAVSVPFELSKVADHIKGFYAWRLLKTMRQKVLAKIRLGYAMPVIEKEITQLINIRTFDNRVTAPLHGFLNAQDYYDQASCRSLLKSIYLPTLIIQSTDDPLVPKASIPEKTEFSFSTELLLTERGGHIGFLHGKYPWRLQYWQCQCILDFLKNYI